MNEADGCDDHRLVFGEDVVGDIERIVGDSIGWTGDPAVLTEPIVFGEEFDGEYATRQDRLDEYDEEIENGGRGWLTADDIRQRRERFVEVYPDEETYAERECHDCGVVAGEFHHRGCDVEECPKCGEQLFFCSCHFVTVEEFDEVEE